VPALGVQAAWLTIKRSLITIYNDVYDEHLFVFAAGLSYYFVLSLFPLLVSMASLLAYVPIPHLFEGLLSVMARLVPGDGMSLVRNIVSDVISHKHKHFLTLGLVFTIWTASSGFAAIIDGLDVVYRVRETRSVWKTRIIVAVMTWIGLSYLLGLYFRHFDSLDKTYGPLGAAIGLYLWFYLSGFAVLLGGEINFLLGELRNRGASQSPIPTRTQINNLNAAA
jgi:uncharacterized BrkB/YihY/UPF0761 family membrane protein